MSFSFSDLTAMDTFDKNNAMREIVDYWTKSKVENETRNVQLTEKDVESLFEVLEGHFMTRTGGLANLQPEVEKPLLECPQCGRMFDKAWVLARPQQSHLNTERFSCTQCDKQFLSSAGLNRHNTKHLQAVQCEQCQRKFTSRLYLDQHVKTHHVQ